MAVSLFCANRIVLAPFSRSISVSCILYKRPLLGSTEPRRPPKAPGNSFILFVKEKLPSLSESASMNERVQEIAIAWSEMTDEERKPYSEQYKKVKEQYLKDKEEFFASFTQEEISAYKEEMRKYRKRKEELKNIRKAKKEGTYDPIPRKVTGYNLFLAEQTFNVSTADTKQRFIDIGAQWKSFSAEEKQPYEDEAAAMTQRRIEEYCERHPEYVEVLKARRKITEQKAEKENEN